MENQLNSSGIFALDLLHCRFFRRSRMIYKNETSNQNNSEIELSSCQCSMTLTGQEKGIKRIVFRIQKKSKRLSERLSQGHLTVLDPGNEATATNLKENGIPSARRYNGFQNCQCFESGNPETSMRMLQTQIFYFE